METINGRPGLRMTVWSKVQSPVAAGLAYIRPMLYARSVCDRIAPLQLPLVALYNISFMPFYL